MALLAVLVSFVAAVNLPILLGLALFGTTWMAQEVGVLLTAVAALVLGTRWVTAGLGRPTTDKTGGPESR